MLKLVLKSFGSNNCIVSLQAQTFPSGPSKGRRNGYYEVSEMRHDMTVTARGVFFGIEKAEEMFQTRVLSLQFTQVPHVIPSRS